MGVCIHDCWWEAVPVVDDHDWEGVASDACDGSWPSIDVLCYHTPLQCWRCEDRGRVCLGAAGRWRSCPPAGVGSTGKEFLAPAVATGKAGDAAPGSASSPFAEPFPAWLPLAGSATRLFHCVMSLTSPGNPVGTYCWAGGRGGRWRSDGGHERLGAGAIKNGAAAPKNMYNSALLGTVKWKIIPKTIAWHGHGHDVIMIQGCGVDGFSDDSDSSESPECTPTPESTPTRWVKVNPANSKL